MWPWHWLGNWCVKLPATNGNSDGPLHTQSLFTFNSPLCYPNQSLMWIEIQGQLGVRASQNEAVCINWMTLLLMYFLSSLLVLLLIIACADSSLTNLAFPKLLLEDYCEILLRPGHLIEWTLQKIMWKVRRDKTVKDGKSLCIDTRKCWMCVCDEGSIRSVSGATLSCWMGSGKRGGVGAAGVLAQAPGPLWSCTHMQWHEADSQSSPLLRFTDEQWQQRSHYH